MMTAPAFAVIGHNNPPPDHPALNHSPTLLLLLNDFLKAHPVIQDRDAAGKGAGVIAIVKKSLKDLEVERDGRVRPLNEEVQAINGEYRGAKAPVQKLLDELAARLTAFADAEEARRAEEARLAREAAEKLEREARAAEAREREALENAAQGEVDVDLAVVTVEADRAFDGFKRADRDAKRAEAAIPARFGTGPGNRSLSMRTTETLILIDPIKALNCIGLTEKIRDAILSSARDYRKLRGALPEGISLETTRKI